MERFGASTDFRPAADGEPPVYGTSYRRPSRKQFKAAVAQLYASYELLAALPSLSNPSDSQNPTYSLPSYDVAFSQPPSYRPPAPSTSSSSSSSKLEADSPHPLERRRTLLEILLPGLKPRETAPRVRRLETRLQRVMSGGGRPVLGV